MSDTSYDASSDELWRRAEISARDGDHAARQELARLAFRDGRRAWAFVWHTDQTRPALRPHPGAVRFELWRAAAQARARERVSEPRGDWAVVGADLDDVHATVLASNVMARGWLVEVSTGAAFSVATLDGFEPPLLRESPDSVRSELEDLLTNFTSWSTRRPERRLGAGGVWELEDSVVNHIRALGRQCLAATVEPVARLQVAWLRAVPRSEASNATGSVVVVALPDEGTVTIGVAETRGYLSIWAGSAHVHTGYVEARADGSRDCEIFVFQDQAAMCNVCGWTPVQAAAGRNTMAQVALWARDRAQRDRLSVGMGDFRRFSEGTGHL